METPLLPRAPTRSRPNTRSLGRWRVADRAGPRHIDRARDHLRTMLLATQTERAPRCVWAMTNRGLLSSKARQMWTGNQRSLARGGGIARDRSTNGSSAASQPQTICACDEVHGFRRAAGRPTAKPRASRLATAPARAAERANRSPLWANHRSLATRDAPSRRAQHRAHAREDDHRDAARGHGVVRRERVSDRQRNNSQRRPCERQIREGVLVESNAHDRVQGPVRIVRRDANVRHRVVTHKD